MTEKKSLEGMKVESLKLRARYDKLQVRYEKAKHMAEVWEAKASGLKDKMDPISQKLSGLGGHLNMEQFGAVAYEVRRDGPYSSIHFFDAQGREVRDPAWDRFKKED